MIFISIFISLVFYDYLLEEEEGEDIFFVFFYKYFKATLLFCFLSKFFLSLSLSLHFSPSLQMTCKKLQVSFLALTLRSNISAMTSQES